MKYFFLVCFLFLFSFNTFGKYQSEEFLEYWNKLDPEQRKAIMKSESPYDLLLEFVIAGDWDFFKEGLDLGEEEDLNGVNVENQLGLKLLNPKKDSSEPDTKK